MSAQDAQAVNKGRQAWWQWWLPYLGGIAGFLALLGSLMAFTISKSIEIYKQVTYKEKITVISYDSRKNWLFLNSGDGEVFLSHMMIRCPELGIDMVDKLNTAVKPKEFLHNTNEQGGPDSETPVSGVSNDEWDVIQDKVAAGENRYTRPCKTEDGKEGKDEFTLRLTFLFSNDNELLFYKSDLGKELRTLEASGELVYFSANSGERLKQDVPLVGVVFQKKVNDKCSPDATPR
jgi:hypothetical protein